MSIYKNIKYFVLLTYLHIFRKSPRPSYAYVLVSMGSEQVFMYVCLRIQVRSMYAKTQNVYSTRSTIRLEWLTLCQSSLVLASYGLMGINVSLDWVAQWS